MSNSSFDGSILRSTTPLPLAFIMSPTDLSISINISAESLDEAIEILLKKQEALENHPCGHLNLELDKITVIPVEPNIFS